MALLVLFFISNSPKKHSTYNHHRCLKLRSSFSFSNLTRHEPVAFDTLVADIERRCENGQWEKQYFEHSHPEFKHDQARAAES
ncbi:hypothetical protein PTKIN_Ptkin02bG0136800 [Pterospermum kingtungense]